MNNGFGAGLHEQNTLMPDSFAGGPLAQRKGTQHEHPPAGDHDHVDHDPL